MRIVYIIIFYNNKIFNAILLKIGQYYFDK